MNTHFNRTSRPSNFASVVNGLITGAFSFAMIAAVGVMTFAQYIAIA